MMKTLDIIKTLDILASIGRMVAEPLLAADVEGEQ